MKCEQCHEHTYGGDEYYSELCPEGYKLMCAWIDENNNCARFTLKTTPERDAAEHAYMQHVGAKDYPLE